MARLCAQLVLGLLLASAAAAEEPILEVRGRMRLLVERVERVRGGGALVTGRLLEQALGDPVSGTVALRASRVGEGGREVFAFALAAQVDADGGFRFTIPNVQPSRYVLRLAARGDTVYAAPEPYERVVDFARRSIELVLDAPAQHRSTAPVLSVVVEARPLDREARDDRSGGGPPDPGRERDLAVDVEIDGRAVTTTLLRDGRATLSLALPPGPAGREIELRVRFAGDEARSPAEASARVRVVDPTVVELASDRARVSAGEEVPLAGHVRVGLAGAVGLPVVVRRIAGPGEREDPPWALAHTDYEGGFHASLRAPRTAGAASFEASFPASEAKARGLLPATSEIVVVEVSASLGAALLDRRPAALALAIGGGVLAVLAAWALRGRLRLRSERRAAPPGPTDAPPRKIFATLRMASDRHVAGRVRDAERGRPLAGVAVTLRPASGAPRVVRTDGAGAFLFAEVETGAVALGFELAGHAPAARGGHVPHRGELGVLEVELTPLRAEVMARYDAALAPYVGAGERLGRRTPRELADAALRKAGSPQRAPVHALRHLVEERCFGARGVGPEVLTELDRLADRLRPPG